MQIKGNNASLYLKNLSLKKTDLNNSQFEKLQFHFHKQKIT